jgi:oxygen-independent coproporphyrinogen-3 oxidase
MMAADDMAALRCKLDEAFTVSPQAEISVEIDPNDMSDDKYGGLQALGITRASLGVQDFDPRVQQAINRIQTFDDTAEVVLRMRGLGVQSVNLDVLYGLPHQTLESIQATTLQILSIRPNRIALFGYAHVPWMKKHQTMIDEQTLPDVDERFAQSQAAAALLREAGYVAIGIDHFALPEDSLTASLQAGRLRRNFQGYTVDEEDVLIGLGASAIGRLSQGHVQNMPATGEYQRRVKAGELATVRGYAMNGDDRARAAVIEKLMCEFGFSRAWLCLRHGNAALPIFDIADQMAAEGDYLQKNGDRYEIIEAMRPFSRQVAARFDAFLETGAARHSMAV